MLKNLTCVEETIAVEMPFSTRNGPDFGRSGCLYVLKISVNVFACYSEVLIFGALFYGVDRCYPSCGHIIGDYEDAI